MSLTLANIPSPTLAWQFESSNADSIVGQSPLASNNSTISYNSIGKYKTSLVTNTNNAAGAPASYLQYSLAALASITVTCWIKPFSVSTASNQTVWGISDSTGTVGNWLQFIVNASTITVYGHNPTTSSPLLTLQMGTIPVLTGAWYHTALTMSATGAIYVYFNGAEIGPLQQYSAGTPNGVFRQLWSTWTASSLVVSSNTRFPGVNSGAWCEYDDLRVFNSVLSASQIQIIYSQNGNPSLGLATLYKSPGYTTPSRLFSVGTPASGSVLAYSYNLGQNTVAASPRCVGFDAGSNIYLNISINSGLIPNSLNKLPTEYAAYFPGATNALIKFNKNGNVVGVSQIMSVTGPTVNSIKSDPQSNVYMLVSGVLGTSSLYNINSTNPRNVVATLQAGQTNVIKYGPDGSLISWGGFPIVTGFTATLYSLALDAGSNVYICGYYQSTTSTVGITTIANPPASSGSSLPITGVYFWPVLLKWSSTGTFLGYTIIRCTAAAAAVVTQIQLGQALCPDTSGNIYWGGTYGSNLFCNINTISTTEPVSNIYSLNTTKAAGTAVTTGSNAFVIQYGPAGAVNKFTELGYGPAASGTQYTVVRGIGLSSTGNVYIGGSFATNSVAGVKLNNFGLVNPRIGTFLTQSGVTVVASGGSQILMCYDSSGTALAASQSQVTFSSSGGAVVVDKNNNIYQAVTHGGQQVTIQNLGQTASSLVTGLNSVGTTNSTVMKFNAAGAAVGFSDLFSSAVNYPPDALAVNNDGVFCVNTFTQVVGSAPLANVAAITTTTGAYVYTLPSTFGVAGSILIKWAL